VVRNGAELVEADDRRIRTDVGQRGRAHRGRDTDLGRTRLHRLEGLEQRDNEQDEHAGDGGDAHSHDEDAGEQRREVENRMWRHRIAPSR
jgi:hypothetical protein